MLKIRDFTAEKESGYKIFALINNYSKLLDISLYPILGEIQEYLDVKFLTMT